MDVAAQLGGPMRWSVGLGRILGIDVYMHATFGLLIAWIVVSHFLSGHSLAATVLGVTFVLGLFGCVVLHELGHALAARHYGIRTRDITLLPIGGVARLERMPEVPIQELWVALAGPAVNGLLSVTILGWLVLTGTLVPIAEVGVSSGSFAERLMLANVFLAVFNMVPAFPMDGGRVLRALLAMRMDYARATHMAASVGQAVALLFGLVGLFGNPMLIFIALFVWIGASQEAAMTQMRSAVEGLPVARAMMTDFRSLAPADTLAAAVDLVLAGAQHDFPVLDGGRLVGLLGRSDLVVALARHGAGACVADVMKREIQTVDADETLDNVMSRLQSARLQTLPVAHAGRLVGLLTMENVGELVLFRTALSKALPVIVVPAMRVPRGDDEPATAGAQRELERVAAWENEGGAR